ncbi:IS481-like element IS1649 family transposase [Actinomadura luteofluorescens]
MFDRRAVAHVAAELGVSRQCAHRWVRRFRDQGWAGLAERRSGPRACPSRTPVKTEERVLAARDELRAGPDHIAAATGVPARTVTRILRRHGVPVLAACDPLTGTRIRASRASERRYEHDAPGEMIHLDVKKLGRIPDGGGWRAHGRGQAVRVRGIGYDFVHTAIDDHTRLAYAEVLPDEKGTTTAAFLTRAAHRQRQELPRLGRLPAGLRPTGRPPKVHPTPPSLDQRQSRTPQPHPGHRMGLPALEHYNTTRPHSALGGKPPITRLSPRS